jgi:hypothetical protein
LKFPPHGFPLYYDTLKIQTVEVEMAAKQLGVGKWLTYGRLGGFGFGFTISRYYANLDLGFWYVGLEY